MENNSTTRRIRGFYVLFGVLLSIAMLLSTPSVHAQRLSGCADKLYDIMAWIDSDSPFYGCGNWNPWLRGGSPGECGPRDKALCEATCADLARQKHEEFGGTWVGSLLNCVQNAPPNSKEIHPPICSCMTVLSSRVA